MPLSTSTIVLCTLNAKYIHASLGLRYLLANMGDLADQTVLREFTIARQPQELADELLALNPKVIGFGVYIWNVQETTTLVLLLKQARPELRIVLGGPEVSYEWENQSIVHAADYLITGWGDISFAKLCRAIVNGPQPLMKVIAGEQCELNQLVLPYRHYSDADLAHRLLYVEASRGCPFKCEFCLSSLDKTAKAFNQEAFLAELDHLYQRGARNFKFVDRTFNLKVDASARILGFFLARMADGLFVHFEVIPDHLPQRLKDLIAQFPPGVLQLEVGIQTFNTEVQQRISRRQNDAATCSSVAWLSQQSPAHVHTDLIFGLPGESLASFATGFDRLYALKPHEIQLGLLKRLRGTPIARHSEAFAMVYQTTAPYALLHNADLDATTVARFVRLARYWDLVANSGRFSRTLGALLNAESAFDAFMGFSDWLWATSGQTSALTPEVLVDALFYYLTQQRGFEAATAQALLAADYTQSGARAMPETLRGVLARPPPPVARRDPGQLTKRQVRHEAPTRLD